MHEYPQDVISEECVRRALAGDQREFYRLYEHLTPRIKSKVRRTCGYGSGIEPDEIVCIVWDRVLRTRSYKEGVGRGFAAWVSKITENVIRSTAKKVKRQGSIGGKGSGEMLETLVESKGYSTSPEELANTKEQIAKLREAFSTLSKFDQVLLQLCEVEGIRRCDVADILEECDDTVRTLLRRARQRLKTAFEAIQDSTTQVSDVTSSRPSFGFQTRRHGGNRSGEESSNGQPQNSSATSETRPTSSVDGAEGSSSTKHFDEKAVCS